MKTLRLVFILFPMMTLYNCCAQKKELIPIQTIGDSTQFTNIIKLIERKEDALYVFDIDNTLLITNENGFGSDWWYTQTKDNPGLKLNVTNQCLFDVLIPMFSSMYSTTALFESQARSVDTLGIGKSRTIALTSRAYSPTISTSTELELKENQYGFLKKDSAVLAPNVVMLNSVIYTRGGNKGEILLDYVKKNPYQSIYFFDDSKYKVEGVQESFSGAGYDISIYYMKVAPKIPYSTDEVEYMQDKLCNLIQNINQQSESSCKCKN